MSLRTITVCPVCGEEKKVADMQELDCPECGFRNAFVCYFASEQSYQIWQRNIKAARITLQKKKEKENANGNSFVVSNNAVAYISKKTGTLQIIFGDGAVLEEKNVEKFSASSRNYAILYKSGKVRVFGDEDNRQLWVREDEWSGIKDVLTMPNCIYAITEEGRILTKGTQINREIGYWTDIKMLASSEKYIVGIKENGQVLIAGSLGAKNLSGEVEGWREAVQVVASRDGCACLHKNGTVSIAGKNIHTRDEVSKWNNIVSIGMDNVYVYALAQDGTVKIAGAFSPMLDGGRSHAAKWEGISAISCSSSCIGGIAENGEIRLLGNIAPETRRIITAIWNEALKPTTAEE